MSDSVIVDTTYGPVRGATDGITRIFRGIRYATPPIGALRWRAPEPPVSWREPADATVFGPAPVQTRNPVVGFPPDQAFAEDCLTLNVWAADSIEPGDDRPVMVWVHGGAYMFGGTAQRMYDGRALVHTGEVVLVTVGYRVGPLGFLDLSRLAPGFDPNPALNDVLAALRWVQENIRGFGGDPSSVTLFGESAGGGIVTTLLTSPPRRDCCIGRSQRAPRRPRCTVRTAPSASPASCSTNSVWMPRTHRGSAMSRPSGSPPRA